MVQTYTGSYCASQGCCNIFHVAIGPYFELSTIFVKEHNARTQYLIALFSPKLVWVLLQNSKNDSRIYLYARVNDNAMRYVFAAALLNVQKWTAPFSAKCNLLFYVVWLVPGRSYLAHSHFAHRQEILNEIRKFISFNQICWLLLNVFGIYLLSVITCGTFCFFLMPFIENCTEIKRKPMDTKNDYEFCINFCQNLNI